MHRSVLLVFAAICFWSMCTAQLNFTPNWGKRGSSIPENLDNCRSSMMDTIMVIYKVIENEAQKLIQCEKMAN
ncbi:hypothetical protein WA026_010401 [Henosepilachna vigintioctopunctata]|uniref:Adipokinetic hormone n=1 Tax=Henosepilachna vigintioctopunctata TaxID=420089 RepID=A0AAW1VD22_9CUCU